MARVQRTTSVIFRHGTTIRLIAAACLLLVGAVSWLGADPATTTRPVVVAARDIPAGTTLVATDLATGQDSLGLESIESDTLVGETVRGPIAEGEPITPSRLTPGRSLAVKPGRVVFPLPLPDDGIAGMLVAGDIVDVVVAAERLTGLTDNEDDQDAVWTAAAGVEVLTVTVPNSDDVLAPGSSDSAVLLDVTTEQASELAAIRRSDRVSLTLAGR
jgi:pilus assembly protein CpaB